MEMPWSEGTAGTDSGATATKSAIGTQTSVVTAISGHTDADSLIQVKDSTTVVFESKIDVSVEGFSFHFSGLNIVGTPGVNMSGVVVTSTTDCYVGISGHNLS